MRRVSNITIEEATGTIIGFEMRKCGMFSYKIKRYKMDDMTEVMFVPAFERRGPTIGLPA